MEVSSMVMPRSSARWMVARARSRSSTMPSNDGACGQPDGGTDRSPIVRRGRVVRESRQPVRVRSGEQREPLLLETLLLGLHPAELVVEGVEYLSKSVACSARLSCSTAARAPSFSSCRSSRAMDFCVSRSTAEADLAGAIATLEDAEDAASTARRRSR